MQTPLLAITLGDPAGVGPETIVGAWADPAVHRTMGGVVLGHPEVLRRAVTLLGSPAQVVAVAAPEEVRLASGFLSNPEVIPCLRCGPEEAADAPPAQIDSRAGEAAYAALVQAAQLALAGRVDGITTAPLNKAALWAAGHHYPGHTELLAALCGVADVAMMLYLAPGGSVVGRAGLGVVHVTLHTALRNVFDELTSERILSRIRLSEAAVQAMLGPQAESDPPRIGVCALNPHAGEEGLFGDEEERIIRPAVEQACREGIGAVGPLPADTLLAQAVGGGLDAVVAMYHDQGHIALKVLDMHRAVNVTLGLPIVRTSVAHGTAFDLAWQGRARSTGMVEALRVAAQLVGLKVERGMTKCKIQNS